MSRTFAMLGCAALAASLLSIKSMPASAGAITGFAEANVVLAHPAGLVEPAQYRGRYNGRRDGGYRRNFGRNAGIGLGAAIIGGIILSEAARAQYRQEHGGDWERCAQTYRSFEPSTGMYTGYDGERRTCPYLN
jgi:BA14K-like protein